jgi:phthalate 4,5-dioxygenase oxygenase subunit
MGPQGADARVRAAGLGARSRHQVRDREDARACNWAQVLEGSIDSAHSSSLHSTNMPSAEVEGSTATGSAWLRPSTDKAPRMQFEATSYGFRYAAIRKPIRNPETHQYVRTTLYIAPFTCLIPPNDQYNLAQMLIPIDDVNTMFYWIAWHPDPKKASRRRRGASSAPPPSASTSIPATGRSGTRKTTTGRTVPP